MSLIIFVCALTGFVGFLQARYGGGYEGDS